MRIGKYLGPAIVVLLSSVVVAFAAQPGDPTPVLSISGELTAGRQLRLSLKAGPLAMKTIKVYSEPSHTPLVILLDSHYAASTNGAAWLSLVRRVEPEATVVTTPLTNTEPSLRIKGRPADDTRIAVWVRAEWPDGIDEERYVADATVGNGGFSFATSVTPMGGWVHCCTAGDCGEMCVTCNGPVFTCCVVHPCCDIACKVINCCE